MDIDPSWLDFGDAEGMSSSPYRNDSLTQRTANRSLTAATTCMGQLSPLCSKLYSTAAPCTAIVSLIACLVTIGILISLKNLQHVSIRLIALFTVQALEVASIMVVILPHAVCLHPTKPCAIVRELLLAAYPLAVWCHNSGVAICLLITVDRYIAVTQPIHATRNTTKGAVIQVILVLIFTAFMSVPTLFEAAYTTGSTCIEPTALRLSPIYLILYYGVFSFGILFVTLTTVIAVLNVIILYKVSISGCRRHFSRARQRKLRVFRTCSGVVICYLLTHTFPGVDKLIEAITTQVELPMPVLHIAGNVACLSNTILTLSPLLNALAYRLSRPCAREPDPNRGTIQSQGGSLAVPYQFSMTNLGLGSTTQPVGQMETPIDEQLMVKHKLRRRSTISSAIICCTPTLRTREVFDQSI